MDTKEISSIVTEAKDWGTFSVSKERVLSYVSGDGSNDHISWTYKYCKSAYFADSVEIKNFLHSVEIKNFLYSDGEEALSVFLDGVKSLMNKAKERKENALRLREVNSKLFHITVNVTGIFVDNDPDDPGPDFVEP